jgi:hypothetical protein
LSFTGILNPSTHLWLNLEKKSRILKTKRMPIILNLTKEGFENLKQSRIHIGKRILDLRQEIEQLNSTELELGELYESTKSLYEPQVKIEKDPDDQTIFVALVEVTFPRVSTFKIGLGSVNEFDGKNEPNLIQLAQQKVEETLKTNFPTYFL